LVHVIAVERRDERSVQQVDDVTRKAIAFVLQLLDVAKELVVARKLVEQADEQARDLDRVAGRPAIEPEEFSLLGDQGYPCHGLSFVSVPRIVARRPASVGCRLVNNW